MTLRFAFLFGPITTGPRPFDFTRIEDDARGLTGTDGSFLGYAQHMAARGHQVEIFASLQRRTTSWHHGIVVRPYEERRAIDESYDAALAWIDIRGLAEVSPRIPRILNLQVNDFSYTQEWEHRNVDLYLAPSRVLARRLEAMCPGKAPWIVAPNGCDPGSYDLTAKVPGRCIFASSPDRGLHLVIEQWPRIRAAVPHATLRIFYHSLPEWFGNIETNLRSPQWTDREHARRACIVRDALPGLADHGVEVIGSVSRNRMAREYSEAQALTGPTDTISFTEGFAVAALEGCASGAIPCISTCDALGDIYAGAAPMVTVPDNCKRFTDSALAEAWSDNVIRALTDEAWRSEWTAKGLAFAQKHAWPVLAENLERIVVEAKARKVAAA